MQIRIPVMSALLGLFAFTASGQEVTVQNDSLTPGDNASICPCFVAGEEAAVWLTAPCDGSIVAIQIFWRSLVGGSPISLEDSIIVYEGGVFPNPGPAKDVLLGPALIDGGLNEFRFKDEPQTIPIDIPVTAGEEFVVSLKFWNNSSITAPSILYDSSGIIPGKNAVKVSGGGGWQSSESLGVTGDWIIRVVIDCTGEQIGAVCLPNGGCVDGMTESEADLLGGVWGGPGSDCSTIQCLGACEIPTTGACIQFDKATCDIVGGTWFGPGTTECVVDCPVDMNGDGTVNFVDVSAFVAAFGTGNPSADFNGDGTINFVDVSAFVAAFGTGCP